MAETSPVASPPAESEADRLAREAESFERAGQYKPASDRYERLARGTGIDAEWALYRLGNLRDRHLGDRAGALAAWREHRRRFPAGSLRQEVDLSIVEVLVRLGKNQEALAEADRFLSRYPTSERRAELARIKERLTP
jgi:tetratricopeptide (TPR) repeat protein